MKRLERKLFEAAHLGRQAHNVQIKGESPPPN